MTSFTLTLLCLFRFFILFFHVLFYFLCLFFMFILFFSCFSVYYYIFIWFLIFGNRRNRAQRYKKKNQLKFTHSHTQKFHQKTNLKAIISKQRTGACADLCRPMDDATVSVNSCVHLYCTIFLLVSSIPSAFTLFMPTLSRGSHSWERDLMETYHFPLTIARSFILCIMSGCGLLCLSSSADRAHRLGSILIWQKVRELEVISVPSRLLSTVQMTGVTNIQN